MKDEGRTKEQLIDELVELRKRLFEFEASEAELKRTKDQMRLLLSAVELSNEGIAVSDLNGNLIYLNDAFAEMHGYSPEELIGKNLTIFHTPEQMLQVEAANRELKETGKFTGEIWHVRTNNTVFPTLMHNFLLKDDQGNPIGMIGTVHDISDIKQVEETLRKSQDQLESQVEDRNAELMKIKNYWCMKCNSISEWQMRLIRARSDIVCW